MNVGVNGKASAISKIFVGVNSIAKEIDQGWIGDGNSVARPFYYLPALKPTPPTSISYSGATVGESLRVSWTAGSSPAGLGLTYVLEVSLNNGGWSAVTTTSGRSYNYTVPTSATYIQFRVKCRDTNGNESDYRTGSRISVTQLVVPTFTGSHSVFGSATQGRLEMYSSGTLTIKTTRSYDIFIVGGGGGGSGENYQGSSMGAGAGAGYTRTYNGVNYTANQNINVQIGSGGSGVYRETDGVIMGNNGGATKLDNYTANGGSSPHTLDSGDVIDGGNGGSGGGASCTSEYGVAGNGGSNGSNGGRADGMGGRGQGTTTKMFGDSSGTLYAGGGGGAGGSQFGSGGSGGGGNGIRGWGSHDSDGTKNTGGGGGGGANNYGEVSSGGSGIAIIRWGY